ncbi:di-heme oxidoredictase family protein [Pseudomarimonas arenosa]|uniref:Cytochrome c domain-containing protein n=1 Tax=Pseudomarimonas arenosa TaxID=2774145 RepID=A0AAW3ZR04_9GAMM|nr:di-heme oxidoredictase family protein [Pseudomarimonas arenosa]MBD8526706.1 hypothetical protein [Pseudomarimonas arenosa]
MTRKPMAVGCGVFLVMISGSLIAGGDGPVVKQHMNQSEIENASLSFDQVFTHGAKLFAAKFNMFDGQGRPATTGGGAAREPGTAPLFLRTSGPDANSCFGCHNDPFPGGAGDNVANVFVLAQNLDPVTFSVSDQFSNERNTLGMQGSGAIEMLAREMTVELQAQRQEGLARASQTGRDVSVNLRSKGVSFGSLIARPNGSIDTSAVAGINGDLILRPFHQKGAVVSLREFTVNAMNHHHGIQAVERFGQAKTGTVDFDQDGVADELSVGDVTATTIWQAALAVPGQVLPEARQDLVAVLVGERAFDRAGCADCHIPSLNLDSKQFVEPNPFNPSNTAGPNDIGNFSFDLTSQGQLPRLEARAGDGAIVRAFTDLKRHNLCDDTIRHYCNEKIVQGGISTEEFLTRKLWDVGNSAPYGHKGDLTTLTEAIDAHGGEARYSRDAYFAMPQQAQDDIIDFLNSLQMLPPGTSTLVIDSAGQPVDKRVVSKAVRVEVEQKLNDLLGVEARPALASRGGRR